MNKYALPGHIVTITEKSLRCGSPHDQKKISDLIESGRMKIDGRYQVLMTEVDGWSSRVYLKMFGRNGPQFNTANFSDVKQQSESDDQCHPDWKRWNK